MLVALFTKSFANDKLSRVTFQGHKIQDKSLTLNQANKKFELARAKFKQFSDLYNKAVKHGNSDFLHNKNYILQLLDSSEYFFRQALNTYLIFNKTIDKANSKNLNFNINNSNQLVNEITMLRKKMIRFYNAPAGKNMIELTR